MSRIAKNRIPMVVLNVDIPEPIMEQLNTVVSERRRETWQMVTRSDVVREALVQYLAAQPVGNTGREE